MVTLISEKQTLLSLRLNGSKLFHKYKKHSVSLQVLTIIKLFSFRSNLILFVFFNADEKLGYNLRESGQYEKMDRQYKEGERMLAETGLERREKKLLPIMHQWDPPAASRKSLMKKEPSLPQPSEPIGLPLTFGESGNSGICVGKFLLNDEEEHKREEVDESNWADVSVDSSPLGPYDQVVRCWKCKATLKVHIEVGLVACPRCRSVSPATDIVIIR